MRPMGLSTARKKNGHLLRAARMAERRSLAEDVSLLAGEKDSTLAQKLVLIVDQSRRAHQPFLDLLGRQRVQVDTATTADAALKLVKARTYEAIFLDQESLLVSGLGLMERILRMCPRSSIVLLGVCGSSQAGRHALKRGALHCLPKPVSQEMLEIVMRSCLERSRLLRQNEELQRKTIQDDLTTAFNRRHLDAYLDEELERVRRYGRTFSILFFDLDHLKDVNSRHGHLAGSRVLREVAQLITGKLRKSDRIFRYGGDEFVVTLPETGADGALCVAERLRRLVRTHRFLATAGPAVRLTASFGVATSPRDGVLQNDLMRAADQAMYLVKTKTRDGVASLERG